MPGRGNMESVGSWAITVCTAAVVCTLFSVLFPDNALGRQGKLLLPCLFLCAFLTPVAGKIDWHLPNVSPAAADTAAMSAVVREQTVRQVNAALTAMVDQALSTYGLHAEKVEATMDIREDGSIDIGQITLWVDETTARRGSVVRQVAKKRLGQAVVMKLVEGSG